MRVSSILTLLAVFIATPALGQFSGGWEAECTLKQKHRKALPLFEGCYKYEIIVDDDWQESDNDTDVIFRNLDHLPMDTEKENKNVVGTSIVPRKGEVLAVCEDYTVDRIVMKKGMKKLRQMARKSRRGKKGLRFRADMYITDAGLSEHILRYRCRFKK